MNVYAHEIEGVKECYGHIQVGVDIAQLKLNWVVAGGVKQGERRRGAVGGG
jgi:hypothetical protein